MTNYSLVCSSCCVFSKNYEIILSFFFQIESMKSLIGFPTSMYNDTFLLEKYKNVSMIMRVNFIKQLF